jgi:hypothetical protein
MRIIEVTELLRDDKKHLHPGLNLLKGNTYVNVLSKIGQEIICYFNIMGVKYEIIEEQINICSNVHLATQEDLQIKEIFEIFENIKKYPIINKIVYL